MKHFPLQNQNSDSNDFLNIVKYISTLVDLKSHFTHKHSLGVGERALNFANLCNFDKERKYDFHIAALFHDLGKFIVPNEIIDKPKKLNSVERKVILSHPYYTEKTLLTMGLNSRIVNWASNHHEKLNGTGYPKGLKSNDLDFESRALGILDILQSLTEDRPYRSRLKENDAFKIINRMVQQHELDGDIVSLISTKLSDEQS